MLLFAVAAEFVPPLGLVFCLVLAIYAMRGTRQTIEAMALMAFLLLLGNSYTSSMGRWLVLFASFGRIVWDGVLENAPWPRILRPIVLFFITIFLFAILVSYIPAVSILKDVTFTMGLVIIMTGLYRTTELREYWFSFFFTYAAFIVFASAPFLVTSYGYRSNGMGFQGILNHSQSFGTVMVPIAAIFSSLYLFYNQKSKIVTFGALIAWVGIFLSQARTSFIATILSLIVACMIGFFMGPKWRETIVKAFAGTRMAILFVIALVFSVLMWSQIQEAFVGFLLKDDGDDSVVASLQDSRGELIRRSMNNFWDNPITGIGFGVPSDPSLLRIKYGPFGIPLGASVEKGFMPSAVLEETGLIGALIIIYLIGMMLYPILKVGGLMPLWVVLGCVIVNFGEMVFFAIGAGDGIYLWLLMGFCHFFYDPVLVRENSRKFRFHNVRRVNLVAK